MGSNKGLLFFIQVFLFYCALTGHDLQPTPICIIKSEMLKNYLEFDLKYFQRCPNQGKCVLLLLLLWHEMCLHPKSYPLWTNSFFGKTLEILVNCANIDLNCTELQWAAVSRAACCRHDVLDSKPETWILLRLCMFFFLFGFFFLLELTKPLQCITVFFTPVL